MDYNTKWDWESLVLFNPKTAEISKQQRTNWEVVEGEEIMVTGPFRLYEGKGNNSSGSELARDSSARSSMSVCTDSSFKEEVKENTQVAFGNIDGFSEDISEKFHLQTAQYEESPSVGSVESLIGLELGKRMYFENNGCTKTASLPELSVKKIKSSNQNIPRCQVAGCNLDLSSTKEYYRKHRVCGSHSKCPKVVVGGLERRFCQQCSRFHSLSEFDAMKKSCRRKLSDHNARRRKPQRHPVLQFNTMAMPFPLSAFPHTEDRRQISFISNNAPPIYSRSFSDPTWESSFSPRYTTTKGCMLEFGKPKGLEEEQLLQLAETHFPRGTSLPGHSFNEFLSSKGAKSETFTRGFEESVLPPNLDSSPNFHQLALSLLSNDASWGSFPTSNNSLDHSININHMYHQPLMQKFTPRFQHTSSELSLADHHSPNSHTPTANDTGHFQLFKAPYENTLYSNLFN